MPKNVSKPRGKKKGTRNAVICVEETGNRRSPKISPEGQRKRVCISDQGLNVEETLGSKSADKGESSFQII